jgi:small subunit ribosomal protein S6
MRFDSSARTQHAVRRTLGLDPRMIRFSVVKMGSKLEEVSDVGGKAEWNTSKQSGL